MSLIGRSSVAALGAAAVFGATVALVTIPVGVSAHAEAAKARSFKSEMVANAAVAARQVAQDAAERSYVQLALPADDAAEDVDTDVAEIDSELVCLAKVIVHEAGNQSEKGQLAVAQVVMNRLHSPKFPKTICSVVMQRGQFFNVHAYNPPKDKRWTLALKIARDARKGDSDPVVGNALFFRAAQVNPPFFRSRPIVGRIGNHYFHE